jgi:membrane fusion protein, multidrug efflux system
MLDFIGTMGTSALKLLPVGTLSCSRPALLSLLLATVMIAGCKEEHPAAEAPAPVRVQRIEVATATEARAYTGVVRARYETDLGFRVSGKITERLVNIGDRVKKDQPLARLDPTDYNLAVKSDEAELDAARSALAQAAADELRYEKLLTERWVAPAAYEQKKAAADGARGRVERDERALDLARNQLAYTELRANEAGIVTALPVEAGQVVAAGQLAVRVAQLAEREVAVAIPESRLNDTRASTAIVDLWSDGSRHYPSTLREFSPQADPITRTYQARFTIQGADDAVALGMTATVRLTPRQGRQVVRLPLGAIYSDGGGASVWVVTEDNAHLHRTPVEVIEFRQNDVLIASGLHGNERVVALGAQLLDDNKVIRIVEERSAN